LGLFAGKTSKKQENCKKAAATNQHSRMKILIPAKIKKETPLSLLSNGTDVFN